MKFWLAFFLVLQTTHSLAQEPSLANTFFQPIGWNLVTQRKIYGYVVEAKHKRFDQVVVDTVKRIAKIKLSGVTKEGKVTSFRSHNLAVYDLTDMKVKWYKNFAGHTTLLTNKYMAFNLFSGHLLDENTGKYLWKIGPSIWYINDARGIGLGADGKLIQGVNMATGKLLWERKPGKHFSARNMLHLDDSTLLFVDNGMQTLNFRTGDGWVYDATTNSRFVTAGDAANIVFDVAYFYLFRDATGATGDYTHLAQGISSNAIIHGDHVFAATRDRISCLTREGKLIWEQMFTKDFEPLISRSTLFSNGDRLYLLNEGSTEVNFTDKPYGKPFLASFSQQDGAMNFLAPLVHEEPVKSYRQTDSTVIVISKTGLAEYYLKDGSRRRFRMGKKNDPDGLKRFANPELLFRSSQDTTYFDQIIAGDNKHYLITESDSLAVFDERFQLLGKVPPDECFTKWLVHDGYTFIGNQRRTIVLNRERQVVATLAIADRSWKSGDRIFSPMADKLFIIHWKEIFRSK